MEFPRTTHIEESTRILWNRTTHRVRFFLSSLNPRFSSFFTAIRSHWSIDMKYLNACYR